MLDRAHRLTSSRQFADTIRRGRRAGTSTLVLHLGASSDLAANQPPRVGLVVGRAVGNAVTRNRVKRRLRHLLRERLDGLPDGALLVVRALAPAAEASSARLSADLGTAWARVTRGEARR